MIIKMLMVACSYLFRDRFLFNMKDEGHIDRLTKNRSPSEVNLPQ